MRKNAHIVAYTCISTENIKKHNEKDQESTRLLSEKNLPLGDICIHYKGQQAKKKIWQQKVNRRKRNLMAEWRETGTKKHGGGNTKLSFC